MSSNDDIQITSKELPASSPLAQAAPLILAQLDELACDDEQCPVCGLKYREMWKEL